MNAKEQALQKCMDAKGDVPRNEHLAYGFGLSAGWDVCAAQPTPAREALEQQAALCHEGMLGNRPIHPEPCMTCLAYDGCERFFAAPAKQGDATMLCSNPSAYADACEAAVEAGRTGEEKPEAQPIEPASGRLLCTKEHPMPQGARGQWAHEDIKVLNDDPERDRCECRVCSIRFNRDWSK